MKSAHEMGEFFDQATQWDSANGLAQGFQVGNVICEFYGVADFLGEEVAFTGKAKATAMQHGERSRCRQAALAKAVPPDPGA